MPKNEQKPALSSLEVRNYKIYQKTAIELRETGEGEESSTIGGYAVKYNTPVLIVEDRKSVV